MKLVKTLIYGTLLTASAALSGCISVHRDEPATATTTTTTSSSLVTPSTTTVERTTY